MARKIRIMRVSTRRAAGALDPELAMQAQGSRCAVEPWSSRGRAGIIHGRLRTRGERVLSPREVSGKSDVDSSCPSSVCREVRCRAPPVPCTIHGALAAAVLACCLDALAAAVEDQPVSAQITHVGATVRMIALAGLVAPVVHRSALTLRERRAVRRLTPVARNLLFLVAGEVSGRFLTFVGTVYLAPARSAPKASVRCHSPSS